MGVATGKIQFNGTDASGLPAIIDVDVSAGAIKQTTPTPWTYTEVDLSTDADVVVTDAACIVGNLWVTTVLSNHTATVQDDSAVVYTLPAEAAAGTIYTHLNNTAFLTNLTFVSHNSMTGKVMVQWKAA